MRSDRGLTAARPAGTGTATTLALAASLATSLAPTGCMPDIPTDDVEYAVMRFDPEAQPPLVPEPTSLVMDPETGLIDFSLAGIDVPADCAAGSALPVAQCELLQYLEALDGFPTLTPARTAASEPLDLATLAAPDDLLVREVASDRSLGPDALGVTFDAPSGFLNVMPRTGWAVGADHVVAVRGYEAGVRAASGRQVVADVPYFLLKEEQSLVCGATTPDELVESGCPYHDVVAAGGGTRQEVFDDLSALEQIRAGYAAAGIWDEAAAAGLPREEAAIVWTFRTHSASVAQLQPALGMVPELVGDHGLRVAVNGAVDPATVTPFSLAAPGSVAVLNLTKLATMDLAGGLPAFAVTVEAGAIVATLTGDAFPPGDQIGVILTRAITNPDGQPLVPSPVTVLLRATGPLADEGGRSLVSGVADADAAELEAGRLELATLLDDPNFALLTGLTRADLVYVYAFTYPNP